jgi:acetyltransferase
MFEDETIFPRLLEALIDDPNMDVIAVNIHVNDPRPKHVRSSDRFATKAATIAADSRKPVAAYTSVVGGAVDAEIVHSLRISGVPLMEGGEFAMTVLRNLSDYHEFCNSWQGTSEERHWFDSNHPQLPSGMLPTEAAFRLLASFGIPAVPTALASDPEEAVTAAVRIGFPVALKIESPAIPHKSDVGGVVLGLATPSEVREAFVQIRDQVRINVPTVEISGVVVQRMASEGVEMIVGMKRDPLFGPIIVCGLGGIFVELLQDVVIGIPPLSREQAHSLIRRLKGWPILAGMRGRPPVDFEALAGAIVGVSRLTASLGEQLLAMDINPLLVCPKQRGGVVAVDALVQIR